MFSGYVNTWPLTEAGNLIRPAQSPAQNPQKRAIQTILCIITRNTRTCSKLILKDQLFEGELQSLPCQVLKSGIEHIRFCGTDRQELILSRGIKLELPPDEDEEADNREVAEFRAVKSVEREE
ncbi:hypothetical protein CEXT_236731 [Caerostris extrusa]|uniref:Uncharacterized protein n=1 Tax=Caerostris extrusa TaxID=172846 RepID=A0AAV4Q2F1_CAEEX|nr:hypothetical protein CEXT_236731 [Caerostris extrusa]